MSAHDYSAEDIRRALVEAGLQPGDVVFTHANVGFFGRPPGTATPGAVYQLFKDAVVDVIGPEGTWVMPTFTYSFCRGEPFDVMRTSSAMGMLSETMRHDHGATRSADANFSVAAIGRDAVALTANPPEHSFGEHSFWDRFLHARGTVCNFNFDAASTFIHFVERCHRVSYRYDKAFPGASIIDGELVPRTFYHFVYDLARPEDAPAFDRFDRIAREERAARTARLGKGQIVAISARETFELIARGLQQEPRFLTVGGTSAATDDR